MSLVLATIVGAVTGFAAAEEFVGTDRPPDEISTTPPSASAPASPTATRSRSTPSEPPPVEPSEPDISPPNDDPLDETESTSETPVATAQPQPPQRPDDTEAAPTRSISRQAGAGAADLVIEPSAFTRPDAPSENVATTAGPDRDRFSERAALISFLGTFLTGLAVVAVASAARSGHDQGQPPAYRATPQRVNGPGDTRVMPMLDTPGEPAPGRHGPEQDGAGQDRATLINTLIHLRDRASSPAIGEHIDQALREVGVTEDAPTGQRFDPTRQEIGGSEPAPDRGSRDIISGVEIVGYRDRGGNVLRTPVVTVYR